MNSHERSLEDYASTASPRCRAADAEPKPPLNYVIGAGVLQVSVAAPCPSCCCAPFRVRSAVQASTPLSPLSHALLFCGAHLGWLTLPIVLEKSTVSHRSIPWCACCSTRHLLNTDGHLDDGHNELAEACVGYSLSGRQAHARNAADGDQICFRNLAALTGRARAASYIFGGSEPLRAVASLFEGFLTVAPTIGRPDDGGRRDKDGRAGSFISPRWDA